MRSQIEHTYENYDCSLIDDRVEITREWLVRGTPTQQLRIRHGFECSHQENCPVAKHGSSGTSYDWSVCPYYKALQED